MGGSKHDVCLRSSARTSIGRVRENNEDTVHLWANDHFALAVVADGMGGAAAGEEASRLAVEAVAAGLHMTDANAGASFNLMSDETIIEQLRAAIHAGNNSIVERAASNPQLRGMGTTVTLALVRGLQALIAHVGDSRAYLVESRTRHITQITADHSFVEALVSAGHLTEEQAEEHPMRNVLYRALGQAGEIDVDVFEVRLSVNDRIILCTDGLTRHVKPQEIAQITLNHDDPDVAVDALVELANARGGEDNISVILIQAAGTQNDPDDASTVELKQIPLDKEIIDVRQPPQNEQDAREGEGRDTLTPEQ
ncbi:MAG: Stp1/IreP family PP2C-type Ser/Thr phosphatase [Aggregatilineales bacterium]